MNPNAKYRHVVITGASSGIGEALALAYARPGITMGLTGRANPRLEAVAARCRESGATVHTAQICVTDTRAMETWLLERDDALALDLLIANAGISAGTGGVLHGEKPQQVRHVFAVNVEGVLNTLEPILPRMLARKEGHVVMLSSLAGFRGWPGAPAYCASKAAVRVYGEALRGSLAGTGVKVSVVCPGFVKTRMTAENDFPMPMIMNADRAAKIITRGIRNNHGRIAFPRLAYFSAWLVGALPDSFAQIILKEAPAKKASH